MSETEEVQKLLDIARKNIASYKNLVDLDTEELVRDGRDHLVDGASMDDDGHLVLPGHPHDGESLPDGWSTFACYPLHPRLFRKITKSLTTTMVMLREYVAANPDCDVTISSLVTPDELLAISQAAKYDERFGKTPKIFQALQETATTCGYVELVDSFHLESIWAALLRHKFTQRHPTNSPNRFKRKPLKELEAELDALDKTALAALGEDRFGDKDHYLDLHNDAVMLLNSLKPPVTPLHRYSPEAPGR